jgi:hypothetical protein
MANLMRKSSLIQNTRVERTRLNIAFEIAFHLCAAAWFVFNLYFFTFFFANTGAEEVKERDEEGLLDDLALAIAVEMDVTDVIRLVVAI